jgi:hypothetical protein
MKEDSKNQEEKNMIDPQQLDLAFEYFKQRAILTVKLDKNTKRNLKNFGFVLALSDVKGILSMIQTNEFYDFINKHRSYYECQFIDLPEDREDTNNIRLTYDPKNMTPGQLYELQSKLPKGYEELLWRQLEHRETKDSIARIIYGTDIKEEILTSAIRLAEKYQNRLRKLQAEKDSLQNG